MRAFVRNFLGKFKSIETKAMTHIFWDDVTVSQLTGESMTCCRIHMSVSSYSLILGPNVDLHIIFACVVIAQSRCVILYLLFDHAWILVIYSLLVWGDV